MKRAPRNIRLTYRNLGNLDVYSLNRIVGSRCNRLTVAIMVGARNLRIGHLLYYARSNLY